MQRRLHWQPFIESGVRKEFDDALKNLQDERSICTWTTLENSFQAELAVYKIYF